MVLTVEPGIYIAKEGIGMRIEDDILITQTGHKKHERFLVDSAVAIRYNVKDMQRQLMVLIVRWLLNSFGL